MSNRLTNEHRKFCSRGSHTEICSQGSVSVDHQRGRYLKSSQV